METSQRYATIILRPHRSTTYVDAAYCYRQSIVVSRSVTLVSPAKTAEAIKMPFALRTLVGLRNHVLDIAECFEPNTVLWEIGHFTQYIHQVFNWNDNCVTV